MIAARPGLVWIGVALACAFAAPASADGPDSSATASQGDEAQAPPPGHLEHLVPELAGNSYRLEPGVRPYLRRLSVGPGVGVLGDQRLFVLRVGFSPSAWLGYEASIGHNPSPSVQAILHRFSAIVRRPLPGRFQPYATAGYGMTIVLPGRSLNADPVTKNALTIGGGLECFVRGDLALRAEMLGMTVIGRPQYAQGLATYDYREATLALAFYRTLDQ